jgi:metallo-beta-lactamase family protein
MANERIDIVEECAAEQVPGSMLRVIVDGKTYLFEAGNEYSQGNERKPLPFDASGLSAIVLGHAHADHVWKVLQVVREGAMCNLYSTQQTAELAKLQFKQDVSGVAVYNKMVRGKRFKFGPNKGKFIPFKPSYYTVADIDKTWGMFASSEGSRKGIEFNRDVKIGEGVDIRFYEAGHIPGAAQTVFKIVRNGQQRNILMAYDLGRTDYKILDHPIADTPFVKYPTSKFDENIDYIVLEATYGNRTHKPIEDSLSVLEQSINDVAKTNGTLIIPAFSIMRTQMLWNFIYRFNKEGKLPRNMMFYSSSPMADDVAKVMLANRQDFDERANEEFSNPNNNPFYFDRLIHHKSYPETKEVIRQNMGKVPIGIIASSGMCDQGRILPILEETISYPNNLVLLTGYSSPGTRASMMINGQKMIPFRECEVELKAKVRRMGGLSGHADAKEIVAHLKSIHDPQKGEQFRGIFIKHGEKEACWALRDEVIKAGYDSDKVTVMKKGQHYTLS